MTDTSAQIERTVLSPRALFILAWFLAVAIAVGRIINGHYCFQEEAPRGDPKRRLDGNHGHISIDFGGQWMMGRMLARGHGRELYSLPRQWEVAEQAYPREREAPAADRHDPEVLIRHFVGKTDRRWGDSVGSIGLMLSPSSPLHSAATATATQPCWEKGRLEELAQPKKGPGVGGPLYPPIQAFVMLPFATGDHPQAAYFAMQYLQVLLCFLAGFGVWRLSRGRIWWPVATAIILIYPGSRGTIDLGQNSALTLTLLIWGWVWIDRERPTIGGIIWGLLAFKPVWALSFFFVLLLMRQWRAALAMGSTSLLLILATLPFVGVHSWIQWLSIGQEAARIYNLDVNWIELSRDVLGIPRRIILDFSRERDQRESLGALVASWALWALVVEITIRVYFLTARRRPPLTGPFPAMIILAAWMCTYHFMYYDALVSVFGVFVLLADPRPFFRSKVLSTDPPASAAQPKAPSLRVGLGEMVTPGKPEAQAPSLRVGLEEMVTPGKPEAQAPSLRVGLEETVAPGKPEAQRGRKRRLWIVNSFVLTVVALMLFHENVTQPLKLQGTWVMQTPTAKRELLDGTTEPAPRFIIGTSDHYPWDTLLVALLWLWCWGTVLIGKWEGLSDTPQAVEGGPDIGRTHQ